jgi:nitrate reductase assembly molybdenum cofactor insertion protein NarJ
MKYLKYYNSFSKLLNYPTPDLETVAQSCFGELEGDLPDAAEALHIFVNYLKETDYHRVEEVYTKTFHIQAICYLDLGYVMFGEDYKRGEFLVSMKQEQAAAGNDCGENLADYLPNVLTLIPKLSDLDFRNELGARILLVSLKKMLDEFRSARMIAREKMLKKKHNAIIMAGEKNSNVYKYVLEALQAIVLADFEHLNYDTFEADPKEAIQSFLTGCGTCSIPKPQLLKGNQRSMN